jgi:hypothetical protein
LLNIASTDGDLAISWIVPSLDLVLEESSDPTAGNWSVQANPPLLDLATLRHQVTLSPSAGNRFFRLRSP